jgi:hypothetical protein
MMTGIASGSWSLVNFILLNAIGAGFAIWGWQIIPGTNWLNQRQWQEIFWLIAALPSIGIAAWWVLSRDSRPT